MIEIFSGTDMICPIEVPNYPGADLSWYRNVSHRCRSVLVPICPGAEVSRILSIFVVIFVIFRLMKNIIFNKTESFVGRNTSDHACQIFCTKSDCETNLGRVAPNPVRPVSRFAPIPVRPDSLSSRVVSPSFINSALKNEIWKIPLQIFVFWML